MDLLVGDAVRAGSISSTNAHLAVPPEPRVILVGRSPAVSRRIWAKFLFLSPISEKLCLYGLKFGLPGQVNTHKNYSGQFVVRRIKCKKLELNPQNWMHVPSRGRELALPHPMFYVKTNNTFYWRKLSYSPSPVCQSYLHFEVTSANNKA